MRNLLPHSGIHVYRILEPYYLTAGLWRAPRTPHPSPLNRLTSRLDSTPPILRDMPRPIKKLLVN